MKLLFLDLETTGLDLDKSEVIQVAAVLADSESRRELKTISCHIESEKPNSPGAFKANGYYRGKWKATGIEKVKASDHIETILNIIKESDCVICHNVSFDKSFLMKFLKDNGAKTSDIYKYFLDSMTLAWIFKFKESTFDKINLDYLAEKLSVSVERHKNHDALQDCRIMMEVFFKLIDKIHITI